MSFLLDIVSDDGTPDFTVNTLSFDTDSFVVGIITGLILAACIWGIWYIIKMFLYNNENDNDEKSE